MHSIILSTFFTSWEWLDEADTMTCAQLGAVLLGEEGLAPYVRGSCEQLRRSQKCGAAVAQKEEEETKVGSHGPIPRKAKPQLRRRRQSLSSRKPRTDPVILRMGQFNLYMIGSF